MAQPSAEELILIKKFRLRTCDLKLEEDSDMFYVRWIRARDGNIAKAEDMLRKHVQYCEETDVINRRNYEPPANFPQIFPIEVLGFDVDNCPIAVLSYGKWDIKKCYEMGLKDEYLKYLEKHLLLTMDHMKDTVDRDGHPVTRFVLILDMDGLSMKFLTSLGAMEITMETLRRFEMNHPERLKKCYVVNASRIFTLLFAVVRPLLSQHTFGKVEIFDSNVSKYSPKLEELIPAEILPAKLGGKNFASILDVPEQNKPTLSCLDNFKKVTVAAGGNHVEQLHVNDEKTLLSWSFLTSNHDIGFSLSCENEELVKYARVEAKRRPQQGSLICHQPGTYKILFDNSYSRMRAKEVNFKVSLGCV